MTRGANALWIAAAALAGAVVTAPQAFARGLLRLSLAPTAAVQLPDILHPSTEAVVTVHAEAGGRVAAKTCRIASTSETMWHDAKAPQVAGAARLPVNRIPARGIRAKDAGPAFFCYDDTALPPVPDPRLPIVGAVAPLLRSPLQEVTP